MGLRLSGDHYHQRCDRRAVPFLVQEEEMDVSGCLLSRTEKPLSKFGFSHYNYYEVNMKGSFLSLIHKGEKSHDY